MAGPVEYLPIGYLNFAPFPVCMHIRFLGIVGLWTLSLGLMLLPAAAQSRAASHLYAGSRLASLEDGALTFTHADPVGSEAARTTAAGEPSSLTGFLPFGAEIFSDGSPSRFRFAGKEPEAATGTADFGARHYQPTTGRFAGADPILAPERAPYEYAASNPFRFVDPTGAAARPASPQSPVPSPPPPPAPPPIIVRYEGHAAQSEYQRLRSQIDNFVATMPGSVFSGFGRPAASDTLVVLVEALNPAGRQPTPGYPHVGGEYRSYTNRVVLDFGTLEGAVRIVDGQPEFSYSLSPAHLSLILGHEVGHYVDMPRSQAPPNPAHPQAQEFMQTRALPPVAEVPSLIKDLNGYYQDWKDREDTAFLFSEGVLQWRAQAERYSPEHLSDELLHIRVAKWAEINFIESLRRADVEALRNYQRQAPTR